MFYCECFREQLPTHEKMSHWRDFTKYRKLKFFIIPKRRLDKLLSFDKLRNLPLQLINMPNEIMWMLKTIKVHMLIREGTGITMFWTLDKLSSEDERFENLEQHVSTSRAIKTSEHIGLIHVLIILMISSFSKDFFSHWRRFRYPRDAKLITWTFQDKKIIVYND
jgi:hypothetical protein